MNYYEHHLGDYVRDTAHLSMLEDGAYRRLLDAYYIREQPFPDDLRNLYKLARAASKAEKAAVDYVLAEFFVHEDGSGWVHGRCDREIKRFQEKQRKAKASADARWGKSERNANASADEDASDMRTHSEGNAPRARPQTPDTSNQEKNPPAARGPLAPHCGYCGVHQSQVDRGFELDHFLPLSAGGGDEPSNRVTSCHVCNQIKQARVFATIDDARRFIHRTLWEKNRERYVEPRKVCFGGVPPDDMPSSPRPTKKCPAAFELTDELRTWAAKETPHIDADAELAKLRDHTFSTARVDWIGTWRNWMRKAAERLPQRNGQQGALSFREREQRIAADRVREMSGGLLDDRPCNDDFIDMEETHAPRITRG